MACAFFTTRCVIGLMIFMLCFLFSMMKLPIPLAMTALVKPIENNSSRSECTQNLKPRSKMLTLSGKYEKHWTADQQEQILNSYIWGFIISNIVGGPFAERFGPKIIVMIATVFSAVLTLLSPIALLWFEAAVTVRFFLGLCAGVVYPSMNYLISRWAPPDEKGRFVATQQGHIFGGAIIGHLFDAITENFGWFWIFITIGVTVIVWSTAWLLLVYDRPALHPRISEEEKMYIVESVGNRVSEAQMLPPYADIFVSIPVWALVILHFGNIWGLFLFVKEESTFLSKLLGLEVKKARILVSLPYLARVTFGCFFGFLGDCLLKRRILSVATVRTGFVLLSHVIPGGLLLALNLTKCDAIASTLLQTILFGFTGASVLTDLQNVHDLAPNYAASLSGVINAFASGAWLFNTLFIEKTTSAMNNLYDWHIMFNIAGLIYITSAFLFALFGSSELQEWNDGSKPDLNEDF